MQLNVNAPVLALKAGQVLTLDDAEGLRILTRTGTVWVTEEGSRKDHIVGPGDTLIVAVGRDIEGTGAGLAIVRQVAVRHGGDAWVRSRDGGGSEFVLSFGPVYE